MFEQNLLKSSLKWLIRNEIDGEPIIIDEANPASNAAIDVVGLDNNINNNVVKEASAGSN